MTDDKFRIRGDEPWMKATYIESPEPHEVAPVLNALYDECVQELEELRADNDRLRTALRELVDFLGPWAKANGA